MLCYNIYNIYYIIKMTDLPSSHKEDKKDMIIPEGYASFTLGPQPPNSLVSPIGLCSYGSATMEILVVQYNSPLIEAPQCISLDQYDQVLYLVTPLPDGDLRFGEGRTISSSWEIFETTSFGAVSKYLRLLINEPELPHYTITFSLTNNYVVTPYFTPNIVGSYSISNYPDFYYLNGYNFEEIVNVGATFLIGIGNVCTDYPCACGGDNPCCS